MFWIIQLTCLLFVMVFSASAEADINVCVENGVKIIRSDPCRGGVTPMATYRTVAPTPRVPVTRAYVQPNRSSAQANSYKVTPPSTYEKGDARFGSRSNQQVLDRSINADDPGTNRQSGGMVVGGGLAGSILPGSEGGMVIGGPLNGSILPGRQGGMVVGGPISGTIWPGAEGGMIHGGPLSGSIVPGSEGGMIHGGPLSGTILPPR